ncbi:MAG: hypothetical protein Q8K58_12140 [Acidimicrobiales bacterium]|nr:hypothetical protein [Acidimicrobiales bacterium]
MFNELFQPPGVAECKVELGEAICGSECLGDRGHSATVRETTFSRPNHRYCFGQIVQRTGDAELHRSGAVDPGGYDDASQQLCLCPGVVSNRVLTDVAWLKVRVRQAPADLGVPDPLREQEVNGVPEFGTAGEAPARAVPGF